MKNHLLFSIQNKLSSLSSAERKVGVFILEHAKDVIEMSTEELSTKAGVSPATVIRFCQSVSNEGFTAFKLKLSAESMVDKKLYQEINPRDSIEQVKDKLSLRIQHTIEQTNQKLSDNSIQQAAQLLKQSDRIYIYGMGASNVVAEDMTQKFLRVGKTVIHSLDHHLITASLSAQHENSVLFLISNSGEKQESIKLAKMAKELHVARIVMTHNANSELASLSSIKLIHDTSEENKTIRSAATTSLIAQLYALNILYYSYIVLDFDENIDKLSASHKIVRDYF
ncbi:MurR/RpiR family transcriptional regulator [Rummeliibacillus pycnus]|uniref:MurR/RpiR family transcriptional regulator n=1 Tax=Rummeliibacillus pycnus TaxID=101070 RepID=UPI003D2AA272